MPSWIVHLFVGETASDPVIDLVRNIAATGGGLGWLLVAYLAFDRFGLIKRKNGNGHGNGNGHLDDRVVLLLEQIMHQLERLNDSGERNARDILAAISNKEG